MDKDYATLGISRTDSLDDITKAYRRLAMQWHPDRNMGNEKAAEVRFKEIQKAYERIAARHSQLDHGQTSNSHGFDGFDPFQAYGQSSGPQMAGEDIYTNLDMPLETAIFGGSVNLTFKIDDDCPTCEGYGLLEGSFKCPKCSGRGYTPSGYSCRTCWGYGRVTEAKCPDCNGKGIVKALKTIIVKIPKGVVPGDILRIRGAGYPSMYDGEPGAVYCKIRIGAHAVYKLSKLTLTRDLDVDFVTALLGGEITTEVFGRSILVPIPAACRAGRLLKLSGEGLRNSRTNEVGDLKFRVVLVMPENVRRLKKEQREMLRTLFSNL